MAVLTYAQRSALKQVYDRGFKGTYLQFRRTVTVSSLMDCALVPYCGMLLGIEPDGYTHS